MKILHITFYLVQGGIERFAVDLCNNLSQNPQNDVHLLTVVDDTQPGNSYFLNKLSKNVTYHNLKQKSALKFKSIINTYKAIKEINPDIVHIHCSTILGYLPALFYKKPKYIQTIHNVADKAISFQWLRPIQRWLFKKELIQPVTISKTCHKTYREFYKLNNGVCITNGIEPALPTPLSNSVKKELDEYRKNDNAPIFLHIARCSVEKNQDLLFKTFERLHNNGKKFTLIIIGANHEESDFFKNNHNDSIKFIGTKQNIGDYLTHADFFILASLWEGLPLSILEAMSAGCITISTPAGGIPDIIEEGKNGFISPSFTVNDFYNTIIRAEEKSLTIDKATVIEHYNKGYTMDICAENYYKLYNKLLS